MISRQVTELGRLGAITLLLAACATPPVPLAAPPRPAACLLARQQPMLQIELYFGRDIPGGTTLSDAQWQDFAATLLAPRFPDGFTVLPASGQWRDPATGTISSEASLMVKIWAAPTADLATRIDAVAQAYKTQFHQLAVGVAVMDGCASFNS